MKPEIKYEKEKSKRFIYDSFIHQKQDSSKQLIKPLDGNEFKPIKIK